MEITGAVHHHRLLLGRSHKAALMRRGGGVVTTTTRVRVPRATCGGNGGAVFCDEGYRQYYEEGRSKQDKKRAKLIKTLKKDLSELYSLGFGVPSDQSDKITEAAKQLLEQLSQIKLEEEEMKKKEEKKMMKKEEKKKAACKMACKEEDSSSCSSESSESDCDETQILKFSDVKTTTATATATVTVPNPISTVPLPLAAPLSLPVSANSALAPVKIEVCMSGKCKKAGAMDVLQEFERQIGGEVDAVVTGCKCLGKCKEGPNVKVSNFSGVTGTVGGEGVIRVLKDQLCIGVGLDDVAPIVAHFFGEEEESDAGRSDV